MSDSTPRIKARPHVRRLDPIGPMFQPADPCDPYVIRAREQAEEAERYAIERADRRREQAA